VVAAVERDEPCFGNAAGDQPAFLHRYGGVIAAMQHKRGRGNARQKVEDIEVSKRPQQPGCVVGRIRNSLQFVAPTPLFERGIW